MISNVFWKWAQTIAVQLIGFATTVVLARILEPSDYGIFTLSAGFISIASVLVNIGFSSSIIQKKEILDEEITAIFMCGIVISLLLYIVLFFVAPMIELSFAIPGLKDVLRIYGLSFILDALSSVQRALLKRNLEFKKEFFLSLIGILIKGTVGITMAINGFDVWSLVFSALANSFTCCVLLWCMLKWNPKKCSFFRISKRLISFNLSVLAINLVRIIYYKSRLFLIGKEYSSDQLAYYSKGEQIPNLLTEQVDGTVAAVLFSTLSKCQDDWSKGKSILRQSMQTSIYICSPLNIGLCVIAEPLIRILFTEKWIFAAPYMQVLCLVYLCWPTALRIYALNARGKSKISLRIVLLECGVGFGILLLTYRMNILLGIASEFISYVLTFPISVYVYQKHLDYSIREQVRDIFPAILLSIFMGIIIYPISFLKINVFFVLILQIFAGSVFYMSASKWLRMPGFFGAISAAKNIWSKANKIWRK